MFAVITRLAVLLSGLGLALVNAAPVREFTTSALVSRAAHAIPAPPHWVAYSDKQTAIPSVSDIDGYNVFILSFLLTTGAADVAAAWTRLSAADRSSIVESYHAAGISLLVSAFGQTNSPTSLGADATETANTMAAWVKQWGVDGIDVDYEDFDAVAAGTATAWVETFVRTLRQQLPAGQYIVTGAPIAPWFSNWYGTVDKSVGSLIDWYNIQFYSQGSEYTTCDGLINNSGGQFPGSSLFEIANRGVTLDKLVVGKPGTPSDASGYIDPSTLAGCIATAKAQGWDAGVSVWEYPDAPSSWIQTVRSQSFPVAKKSAATHSSSAKTHATSSAAKSSVTQ